MRFVFAVRYDIMAARVHGRPGERRVGRSRIIIILLLLFLLMVALTVGPFSCRRWTTSMSRNRRVGGGGGVGHDVPWHGDRRECARSSDFGNSKIRSSSRRHEPMMRVDAPHKNYNRSTRHTVSYQKHHTEILVQVHYNKNNNNNNNNNRVPCRAFTPAAAGYHHCRRLGTERYAVATNENGVVSPPPFHRHHIRFPRPGPFGGDI